MRDGIYYVDLGANANGDENGNFIISLNGNIIKKCKRNNVDRFIEEHKALNLSPQLKLEL